MLLQQFHFKWEHFNSIYDKSMYALSFCLQVTKKKKKNIRGYKRKLSALVNKKLFWYYLYLWNINESLLAYGIKCLISWKSLSNRNW